MLVETIVQPDGFVATAHVHPYQSERFEVLAGELGLEVGGDQLIARPHFDTVRLPAVPVFIQRAGLAVGALLGRLMGYKPSYAGAVSAATLATA